jgi:hypothetical protein
MAIRTPAQHRRRHRIEQGIQLAAPYLDLVLAVGERLSRFAGRNDVAPEPPRRPRTSIGASTRPR